MTQLHVRVVFKLAFTVYYHADTLVVELIGSILIQTLINIHMLVYNSLLHKMGHRYVHLELLGGNPSLYSFATFILALSKRHEFPTFHCVHLINIIIFKYSFRILVISQADILDTFSSLCCFKQLYLQLHYAQINVPAPTTSFWAKVCKFTEKCEKFTEINVKFTGKKSGKREKFINYMAFI